MITKILLIGMLVLAIALCVIHMMPKKIRERVSIFRIAAIGAFVAIQLIFFVVHFVDTFAYPQSVQELESEISKNNDQIYELRKEIETTEALNESSSAQEFESTKVQQEMIYELEEKNHKLMGDLINRRSLDDLFIIRED